MNTGGDTERQVQRAILRMCGTVFPDALIAHIPNGAHLAGDDRARFRQMGAMIGDGLKPGMPDLLVLWNYGCGFLEVKRPKVGRVSDKQEAMIALLKSLGHRVEIVTSALEAQQHMLDWGVPAKAVRWAA